MTYNTLNTSCRYEERKALLRQAIVETEADIVALQEVNSTNIVDVRYGNMKVEFSKGIRPSQKTAEAGFCIEGVAVMLSNQFQYSSVENLYYEDDYKLAQRVHLTVAGRDLVLVNTHLNYNTYCDFTLRAAQVAALVKWMSTITCPVICAGDFNINPTNPPYATMRQHFKSAYWEVHGSEPALTFPTGLWGAYADPGRQEAVDFIWYRGEGLHPVRAWLGGTHGDTTRKLWGSDHYAVVADFEFRP